MIAGLIRTSIANRGLVLLAAVLLAAWGIWSVLRTPLDALPDLSDTQVIIRTEWPGQTPRIIEDQVTYPLTTTMLSVPGVRAVLIEVHSDGDEAAVEQWLLPQGFRRRDVARRIRLYERT